MDNKKTNGGKMSKASMVGVRARIDRTYEQLKKDFYEYHRHVYGFTKEYDPRKGYDQLGDKLKDPSRPTGLDETLLYSTYAQLKLVEDIRPDLKYAGVYA